MHKLKVRKKYSMLTPMEKVGSTKLGRNAIWKFRCDCGQYHIAQLTLVKRGTTTRCKACSKLRARTANLKHGKKGSRIYSIYWGMRHRCTNKKHIAYPRYQGRGILICARWNSFENFLEDMGEPPTNLHTLDRIDNYKGYCKSNCRWATKKEQNRNSRANILFTYRGVRACLAELCERFSMPYNLVWDRVNRSGWSIERAIETKKLAAEVAGVAT